LWKKYVQSAKKMTRNGPEIVILKYGSIFIASDVSLDRNSLDRGQCYLLWCIFANNSTHRGQYYVISGSKIIAYLKVSVTYCSVTLKKLVLNRRYFWHFDTLFLGTIENSLLMKLALSLIARPFCTEYSYSTTEVMLG
jgi:hypothetical protein